MFTHDNSKIALSKNIYFHTPTYPNNFNQKAHKRKYTNKHQVHQNKRALIHVQLTPATCFKMAPCIPYPTPAARFVAAPINARQHNPARLISPAGALRQHSARSYWHACRQNSAIRPVFAHAAPGTATAAAPITQAAELRQQQKRYHRRLFAGAAPCTLPLSTFAAPPWMICRN